MQSEDERAWVDVLELILGRSPAGRIGCDDVEGLCESLECCFDTDDAEQVVQIEQRLAVAVPVVVHWPMRRPPQ